MVRVRFFASLKDIVGQPEIEMKLEENTSVHSIFQSLREQFPELGKYESVLLVAVNQTYSKFDSSVSPGDEVAFFPPVSGGRK